MVNGKPAAAARAGRPAAPLAAGAPSVCAGLGEVAAGRRCLLRGAEPGGGALVRLAVTRCNVYHNLECSCAVVTCPVWQV